jgi:hypothetical protein
MKNAELYKASRPTSRPVTKLAVERYGDPMKASIEASKKTSPR